MFVEFKLFMKHFLINIFWYSQTEIFNHLLKLHAKTPYQNISCRKTRRGRIYRESEWRNASQIFMVQAYMQFIVRHYPQGMPFRLVMGAHSLIYLFIRFIQISYNVPALLSICTFCTNIQLVTYIFEITFFLWKLDCP